MGLPGITLAIHKDGTTWTFTDGSSDLKKQKPVDKEDRFGIGSITKTFVAVITLQLYSEGKLDLSKTALDYLKESPYKKTVEKVPNADKATILQLLNHTSGVPTWEFVPEWIRAGRGSEIKIGYHWKKDETLKYCFNLPPTNVPGEAYNYSNTNYTLLGLIIETITKTDFTVQLSERILKPYHIENTYLDGFEKIPEDGKTDNYHYATPLYAKDAGINPKFPYVWPTIIETSKANLSTEFTAGGLVSTPSDLIKFADAIRKPGKLLDKKAYEAMYKPRIPKDGLNSLYLQGIEWERKALGDHSGFSHWGGVLGYTGCVVFLEDSDTSFSWITNVGVMHSFSADNPLSHLQYFHKEILCPAIIKFLA